MTKISHVREGAVMNKGRFETYRRTSAVDRRFFLPWNLHMNIARAATGCAPLSVPAQTVPFLRGHRHANSLELSAQGFGATVDPGSGWRQRVIGCRLVAPPRWTCLRLSLSGSAVRAVTEGSVADRRQRICACRLPWVECQAAPNGAQRRPQRHQCTSTGTREQCPDKFPESRTRC